jgi:hypothetical protein
MNANAKQWTEKQRYDLNRIGVMRILKLKIGLLRCKQKE